MSVPETFNYDFRLPFKDDETLKELADDWQQKQIAADAAKRALMKAVEKSDLYKNVSVLASKVNPGAGFYPRVQELHSGHAIMRLEIHYTPSRTHPTKRYMDPSTLNQVLNSRLLTDDQKRKVLAQELGGVFTEFAPDEKENDDVAGSEKSETDGNS